MRTMQSHKCACMRWVHPEHGSHGEALPEVLNNVLSYLRDAL